MKIFIDTANIENITNAFAMGCVSGVTTNPTIISRENKTFEECITGILSVDDSLVLLLEAVSSELSEIIEEADKLTSYSPGVVIKIPATETGLMAIRTLSDKGIKTAATLVFSLNQAILAACAGASYVAPFVGRLDDIDSDGVGLVESIKNVYVLHNISTKIISASIRGPHDVTRLFQAGSDIVTLPYNVLQQMIKHPLTDRGLAQFELDWKSVPQV